MSKLILDGCLVKLPPMNEVNLTGIPLQPLVEIYALTGAGVELVERLIAAKPLE